MLNQYLQQLGFGEKEIAVYLCILENGKLSDLKDTVRVHLSGINQGNFIKVTELEIVTSTTNP